MFTDISNPVFLKWQGIINFWIFVSCLSLVFETVEPLGTDHEGVFKWIDYVAVMFFATDYLGNLYFAQNRIKYFFSFWGLVDLISIIPSFLMMFKSLSTVRGTKVVRLLRVVRVLRVLKMARSTLQQMGNKSGPPSNPLVMNLKIYMIALFSVMMISSTLMYYFEGGLYTKEAMAEGQAALDAKLAADPASKDLPEDEKKFVPMDPVSGNPIPLDKHYFTSIPSAMWWCIVTLTTTGYGDMYPTSFVGRCVAGVTMLMGLVLFGILMNIVGKTLMVLLFGEQLGDSSGPSHETVLKEMLQAGLISGAQYDAFQGLPPEEIRRRLEGNLPR